MKVLKIHSLRGPNFWSVKRKELIVLKLDLEALNTCHRINYPVFPMRSKPCYLPCLPTAVRKVWTGGFLKDWMREPGLATLLST
ncbi:MAG: hypothetical protein WC785_06650 [Tatlockia sp.]|jgi:hypothetical protein